MSKDAKQPDKSEVLSEERKKVLQAHIAGTPMADRPALISAFEKNKAPKNEVEHLKALASSQPKIVRPKRRVTA